ncbi:hypothetical protein MN116_002766 [Schistosoma mekongi]|uniref:C2H2-type domain-containing protein n=1 Tax=Schistosoma mekongi TaxID=38744 RepID=A0AAE1ZHL1_SCHME|nr:hypothetical protein MN116_002766 [Schistosoma mekongi]
MLKNSMSTLVLPNFHKTTENCLNFRNSLNVDSNLPNIPPVSNWNYDDTSTYASDFNVQSSNPNMMDNEMLSNHIVNHYHNAQTILNSSKQSLPHHLPSYGDSGCLSLTDETSMISVKHSTSTPVHTVDNDSTPTSHASTATISPINIDSLDNISETQIAAVTPSKVDINSNSMKDYYTVASTTTNSTTISDNTNNYLLNEEKYMKITNYSENKTPLIKQTTEDYKRNWDVLNTSNIIKIKQQDEINQDESHSDSELNLSSESISRKNRADVKIQPYALRGNIEVFRCPLCSKDEIFSRGHLTNHLQDHQSNFKREDYKHVCCFCFSELSSNSSLERHLLTHTNHRPFNCNLCDKAFTTNGNLSRHVRTSHQVKTTVVTNLTSFTSTGSTSPIYPHTSQQPTFLPNWYQSSTNSYMSPISNVYSKTKTPSQHTTEINKYQDVGNPIQKSSVKQPDSSNYGMSSSKKLKSQQRNDPIQNRESRSSNSQVNLIQSLSNSYNKQCDVTEKSCIKDEPNTSFNENEYIKPIKFTSINANECQTDCLSTSYTDNLMDYSTNYSKHEQCRNDNFDKLNTVYSWVTQQTKHNWTYSVFRKLLDTIG